MILAPDKRQIPALANLTLVTHSVLFFLILLAPSLSLSLPLSLSLSLSFSLFLSPTPCLISQHIKQGIKQLVFNLLNGVSFYTKVTALNDSHPNSHHGPLPALASLLHLPSMTTLKSFDILR